MKLKINNKSVFILGAGASHTYGFPLGTGLRDKIVKDYQNILNQLRRRIHQEDFLNVSIEFINKFKLSSDMSIDLFLSKFPQYEFVGKVAIIYNILQAEKTSLFLEDLKEYKNSRKENNDDWMWHLYYKLTIKLNMINDYSKIDFNDVSFITFNYDRSLEHFIYTSFENGFDFGRIGGSSKELIKKINIHHVYGKVANLPWEGKDERSLTYKSYNIDQYQISKCINNIKVIYDRTSSNLDTIRDAIEKAGRIYLLGFGYDQVNLKILGFPDILSSHKKIFGTALNKYPEEIEQIKSYLKTSDSYEPQIIDCNCTELLRRFFN